jgi:hypothetical protein
MQMDIAKTEKVIKYLKKKKIEIKKVMGVAFESG